MIVSLDRKGKALFWQIESNENDNQKINSRQKVGHSGTEYGLKTGSKLVNIGEWQVCIRDRGDIVASTAFENVVMVGFESGLVALFYLGMRDPFVEFNSGSYTVKRLLFSQVSLGLYYLKLFHIEKILIILKIKMIFILEIKEQWFFRNGPKIKFLSTLTLRN